ncbi:uncharacterized protein LOC119739501 [Patiria miniata]|uniref:EGF-like domain-containing protein n=1 Tax=Patiria miniata TaxID=46514 RepID=A0A914B3M5_PATMI|nr:uncharacterized protein LOC119739501 [Patiria miniata]
MMEALGSQVGARAEFSSRRERWRLVSLWILLTITLAAKSGVASDSPVTSNVGRIFSFLVPGNDVNLGNGPRLYITSPPASGRGKTHVRVIVPKAEFSTSVLVDPGTTGVVQLPFTAMGVGTGPQPGTVRVEAASPVTVQAMVNLGGQSSEAFLAQPLESLGMEYIASSTTLSIQSNETDRSQAMLTITGVCDGTSVSVKAAQPLSYLGVVYKTGRTLRVMVDSGGSIQIRSNGGMTGTRVTSDKPIAVLLANTCPAGAEEYHCFYSVEQLSPVYALGKQFLLAQFVADTDSGVVDEVLVLATRPGTTVEIPGSSMSRRLGRGEQWHLPTAQINIPFFLVADQPVQVTQYSVVLNDIGCSPQQESCAGRFKTMTVVPPLEQFTDRADFTVLSAEEISPNAEEEGIGLHVQNVLTVLTNVACDDLDSGLLLTSDQSENTTWAKVGVSNRSDACVLRAEVQPGTVHLDADLLGTTAAKFAALLYGIRGRRAYSLPVTAGGTHLRYISREIEKHECTVDSFDPCEDNPCQHRGDCIRDGDGYQCSCISPFYEGPHCETEVDPCSFEVPWCFNGGTCNTESECLCPPGWGGTHCERDVNARAAQSSGREFVFTFMEHPTPRRSPSIVVSTDGGKGNTLVNVSVPISGFMESFSIPPNQAEKIQIPVEAISTGSHKQPSGVLVSASQDITVVGFHNSIAPGDGFLALPVTALGTRHHVVAARQRKKRHAEKSQIAIVAATDDTTVFIRIYAPVTFEGKAYAAYSSIMTKLQMLDVAQLQSKFDMTRAQISSDKPVALLSGSTCGYTMYEENDRKRCDFMVEQLPPLRSWNKRFVVTPFMGNSNGETTVRIIGGPGKTDFSDGSARLGNLYDGSMQELYITRPTYISATQPVLVVAFSVQATSHCSEKNFNDCEVVSSPTMAVVPSLNQFTTSAILSTPSVVNLYSLSYKNYVNIIASDCSDIRLSRHSEIATEKIEWHTVDNIPFTGLCFVSKEIDPGQYLISSEFGKGVFSAQLYGFNNHGSAYGFPLAQNGRAAEEFVQSSTGSEGKEFILTFLSGGNYYPTEGPRLLITSSTDAAKTEVTVSGNGLDVSLTLAPYEAQVVDVPPTLIGIQGHQPYPDIAVHVRSSHDITVYGMNDAYVTTEGYDTVSDGYLALPVPALGREYSLVTSWPIYQHYPTRYVQFAIIGVHDGTRVDITLNSAVFFDGTVAYGGSLKTIRLNKKQVAYFKSYNDHTGTRVISTKPVAVISGTDCGFAPRYPNDGPLDYPCDHQVQFLMPESRWGRTFLLATLQGYQGGDVFIKIQVPHHFTSVKYGSGTDAQALQVTRFNVGSRGYINSTILNSNKQVSVTAFTIYQPLLNCVNENGSCEGHSRPLMFTIPPVESFKRKLVFPSYRIRGADDMANYADVYTKCSEAEFVLVNGVQQSWEHPLEEIEESGYCVLRLQLASDETVTSYMVESSLEGGRLGVITYGFSTRSGYAFPGGFK